MHDIEPHFHWRDHYIASEDRYSPFFRRQYDEFQYTLKVYNYFIHPQWDQFGSTTLYGKVLFVDYDEGFAILELIGEWNDCLHNDIEALKRNLIDPMIKKGIYRYVLVCESVFNFHADDVDYYEEWWDDIKEENGWVCLLNTEQHVYEEIRDRRLDQYVHVGPHFNHVIWRPRRPELVYLAVNELVETAIKLVE